MRGFIFCESMQKATRKNKWLKVIGAMMNQSVRIVARIFDKKIIIKCWDFKIEKVLKFCKLFFRKYLSGIVENMSIFLE